MGKPIEIRLDSKGRETRRCLGPLHKDDDIWLPLDQFHLRKSRYNGPRPRPHCKLCGHFIRYGKLPGHSLVGRFYFSNWAWIMKELENRLGVEEAIRRTGIGRTVYRDLKSGRRALMQGKTLERFITTLAEVRATGEVRHRHSIARGAHLRGEEELVPKHRRDFYRQHGDEQADYRKRKREREQNAA